MSATHEGTCPICLRRQKIVRAGMARHGYRRRWHRTHGSCWGTDKTPWEMPGGRLDAQRYVDEVLDPAIAERRKIIERIQNGEVTEHWHQPRPTSPGRTVTPADPDWATIIARHAGLLRSEIEAIEMERRDIVRRIASWMEGALSRVTLEPPVLPFVPKPGEVVLARQAPRGIYGQMRYEVWTGERWTRVPFSLLQSMIDAGTARWLQAGERPQPPVDHPA